MINNCPNLVIVEQKACRRLFTTTLNTRQGGTEGREVILNLFSAHIRDSVANKIQTETLSILLVKKKICEIAVI
jgi:hypothetical protein